MKTLEIKGNGAKVPLLLATFIEICYSFPVTELRGLDYIAGSAKSSDLGVWPARQNSQYFLKKVRSEARRAEDLFPEVTLV